MGLDDLSKNLNITLNGQDSSSSKATRSSRIIYPAIVRSVSDFSNMGRIQVEIISIDDKTGIKQPGKDANTPLNKLPVAIPLLPSFFNSMPQIDEMVLIMFENPSDQSSTRYWIGPIRTTKFPLVNEGFERANYIYQSNTFGQNGSPIVTSNNENLPGTNFIYIKGKDDSDITFKSREILFRAGTFTDGTQNENTDTPCKIRMFQRDGESVKNPYSQINIQASNINLISTDANSRKNRSLDDDGNLTDEENIEKDTNERLNDFGSEAKKLHPLVLGDELVKVLKVLIRFCLNHSHTPQKPAYAPTEEIDVLNEFLADENIKFILSNTVRTN